MTAVKYHWIAVVKKIENAYKVMTKQYFDHINELAQKLQTCEDSKEQPDKCQYGFEVGCFQPIQLFKFFRWQLVAHQIQKFFFYRIHENDAYGHDHNYVQKKHK